MATPNLLPCPFCGSSDLSFRTEMEGIDCRTAIECTDYVACGNCGAQGPPVGSTEMLWEDTAAAAAWNQRSAWQPIETALGDGSEVFVWDGAKAVVAVSEHDFVGDVIHWPLDEWGDKRRDQPPVHGTHWQPRLSPPPITP